MRSEKEIKTRIDHILALIPLSKNEKNWPDVNRLEGQLAILQWVLGPSWGTYNGTIQGER